MQSPVSVGVERHAINRKLSDMEEAGIFLSLAPRSNFFLPPLKRARVNAPFIPQSWENRPPRRSLDDLKDKCLVEILHRLDSDRDRSAAACVSKRWLSLLVGIVDESPKNSLLDLNITVEAEENEEDDLQIRCLEGLEATDFKLFAMAIGSRSQGGIGKLSIRSASAVTDLGLAAIARHSPDLRSLSLWNVPFITDKGISLIANHCPLLEKLDLCGCPLISDKGISAVAMKCRGLNALSIESCANVGDDCLWAVGHYCSNLASISIVNSPLIGDKGVSSLISSSSSSLGRIVLRHLSITDLSAAVIGRYGKSVTELVLADLPNLSEKGLWVMGCAGGLRQLSSVSLSSCGATDLGLEAIARGCPSLKKLSLRRSDRVTDAGLKRLFSLSLESLQLEECGVITLPGVVGALIILRGSLRSLSVIRCREFGDVAAYPEPAKLGFSSLRSLTISHCPGFGDSSLIFLGKLCKNIQKLRLLSLPGVSDSALSSVVKECGPLVKVNLHGCKNIGNGPVKELVESHGTTLRTICLADCKRVTDVSLAAMAKSCARLDNIDVSGSAITDAGVTALASSAGARESLALLSLAGCAGVSERSLVHLGGCCRRLRGLNLQLCSSLTGQDVASFQTGMVGCDVLY